MAELATNGHVEEPSVAFRVVNDSSTPLEEVVVIVDQRRKECFGTLLPGCASAYRKIEGLVGTMWIRVLYGIHSRLEAKVKEFEEPLMQEGKFTLHVLSDGCNRAVRVTVDRF